MKLKRIAVIGAGPGGLAAAKAMSGSGFAVVVFEAGASIAERDHASAIDLGSGVGGSGLFSDGKFSFYPANSSVYRLENSVRVRQSYDWFCSVLTKAQIEPVGWPKAMSAGELASAKQNKSYPVSFSTLTQRIGIINELCNDQLIEWKLHSVVKHIYKEREQYSLHWVDSMGNADLQTDKHELFDGIVVATGRFGALFLEKQSLLIPLTEERYEFGIRIECSHAVGFFSKNQASDLKWIWSAEGIEYRTFCSCRNGEVWNISYPSINAISGRSDVQATGYDNFAILARFTAQNLERGRKVWSEIGQLSNRRREVRYQSLIDFVQNDGARNQVDTTGRPWHPRENFKHGNINEVLGETLTEFLRIGVSHVIRSSPEILRSDTVCFAPVVEGVGHYPKVDGNLRVKNETIWFAGDVVGSFRGLVAAFMSGYYVGASIQSYFQPK